MPFANSSSLSIWLRGRVIFFRHTQALHDAARVDGARKHLQSAAFVLLDQFGQVGVLETKAPVGLVVAEAAFGFFVGHAFERNFQFKAQAFLPNGLEQAFDHREDVVLFDEGHLDVDLRELGLPVDA